MSRAMKTAQRRMLSYKPPSRDIKFVFDEVLRFQDHYKTLPPHVSEECTPEFVDDVLSVSEQLAEQLLPLYQSGDQGCIWKDGDVKTPPGFKEVFNEYRDGGWNALCYPTKYGGMNLPMSVSLIKNEICATANWSWFMYPGLSLGASSTINLHCSDELKEKYLPNLVNLTWTGTMCLTEPHCGTDLGQMRTKAVPNPDGSGSYLLTGNKIFISAGEHDMSENIIHIVLAKLPDAPPGTKGISLFLVPKYKVDDEGNVLKDKKNVQCGGIEKKMGIHGNATCQINFDSSEGFLIGEPHDGLRQMFTFMNTARIGTGIQGLAHMELAYQNAVAYCQDRMSLRALSGTKDKDQPADAIIHHGDVRRRLMTAKALIEGSRAMLFDVAKFSDQIQYAEEAGNEKLAKELDNEMGFLTPVVKGCVTEWGYEVSNMCLDTFGGHGYIKDHGMEQIVRDAKIATLYEGTTGIQALDMLGRKMMLDKLRLFKKWNKNIRNYAWEVSVGSTKHFRGDAMRLYAMAWEWHKDVLTIGARAYKNKDMIGVASHDQLFNAGYILMGYYWLRMGTAAEKALEKKDVSESDRRFYEAKIKTGKWYFTHVINRAATHRLNMTRAPDAAYALDRNDFHIL